MDQTPIHPIHLHGLHSAHICAPNCVKTVKLTPCSQRQSRYATPSITPHTEVANPFLRGGAESLLEALASKLGASKAPGGSSPSTPASNSARNYQTTHHGSNAAQPRVQRRSSRSTHRAASRSLSSSRHDPSHHSGIKWRFENNPHVSFNSAGTFSKMLGSVPPQKRCYDVSLRRAYTPFLSSVMVA